MSGGGGFDAHARNDASLLPGQGSAAQDFRGDVDPAAELNAQDLLGMLPSRPLACNEGFITGLALAARAIKGLDAGRCLIVGIDIGFESATVRLARAPSAALQIEGHRATYTGPGGDRIHINRGRYLGATVEWREGA